MITEEVAKRQLEALHEEGRELAIVLSNDEQETETETGSFAFSYQRWYSRALPLMKQVAPDRYAEFQRFYSRDPDAVLHWHHDKVIQDYFYEQGAEYPIITRDQALRSFLMQLAILKSVTDRLEWMALDTEDHALRSQQLAFLVTARELIKVSERAAGALAGAVLDAYLKKLAAKHQVKLRKSSPAAGELAEALKEAKVFDVPVWSQATWLAEIHGRCLKEGEAPTKLQIRDLIDGTHWLLTNVF